MRREEKEEEEEEEEGLKRIDSRDGGRMLHVVVIGELMKSKLELAKSRSAT